jgi:DNA-binding MarR family transcriptional regulator
MEQASLFGAPDPLDLRAPAQRRSHASRRAAEQLQASGRLSARMAGILRVFRAADPETQISSELAAATGILRQSLTAPIARARARGWIVPVGLRPGPHGAEQTSFRITAAGLAALREYESAPPPASRRRRP